MESNEATPVASKRRRCKRATIAWTPTKIATFFEHLSIGGNITQAAAAIGVSPTSVHLLRARDTAFADAWEDAIEAGYATIEMRLIGHVLAGLGAGDPIAPVGDVVTLDVDQAFRLLREYAARLRHGGGAAHDAADGERRYRGGDDQGLRRLA